MAIDEAEMDEASAALGASSSAGPSVTSDSAFSAMNERSRSSICCVAYRTIQNTLIIYT